jgi:glucose-1-phosphate adenylyltransferase
MKTRAIILAGGEGTRLGVLTAKRTKPAVPFAGKYRIIDFPLSNCVNSELFDVMIVAQYRPHSLIEHIGAGGPWDLNRDFTGGVRIYTPYRARGSDWFIGTADAVQQNYSFIKRDNPDLILVLSGDHVYTMDYRLMIQFHQEHQADLTMAVIQVPIAEASRFGILNHDFQYRVTSFVEKPKNPESNLINMGVYLFNNQLLDNALWEDHLREDSSHDFGKDIIPNLIAKGAKVFAYPYSGYWVDVGTVNSYWNAHMDLLDEPPKMDLYSRSWVIHTRTEERPPARFSKNSFIEDSMISNGCVIESGARIQRSFLSPGVIVRANATVRESIILTDSSIASGAIVERAVIDKRVKIGVGARVGAIIPNELQIAMVGKNSMIPDGLVIEPLGMVGVDVCYSDFSSLSVQAHQFIQTKRLPNEI